MRKEIGLLCALAAVAVLTGGGAQIASGGEASGIRGVVLNTTCVGPCIVDQQPQPYPGSDLRVVIRRLPSGDVARRLKPKGGRFSTRLRRGRYRVNAYVAAPCWSAEAKRVRVRRGKFSNVRLHVQNSCILCPVPATGEALICPPPPPCLPCEPCQIAANALVICPPCPLPTAGQAICAPCPPGKVCIQRKR